MNSYPMEFLERMKRLLEKSGESFDDFLYALNKEEQKGIFVNPNKIDALEFAKKIDFSVSRIPYEENGFYIENIKLGRHPLHHAGAFYVQDPSAMFTVNAVNFKGSERVLDMCASPGGKSIQIASRLQNGILVANEINKSRSLVLYSNIERMGLKNVVITNDSPQNIGACYANTFDVVLLDAPCSGEGMFRRGERIVREWNENLDKTMNETQKEIVRAADRCLKQNGILIYSTCTYSELENEQMVRFIIKNYGYELVQINAPKNFSLGINMPKAVRLYPHKVRGEGQFVAVLKKISANNYQPARLMKLKDEKSANKFVESNLNIRFNNKLYKNSSYYVLFEDMIKQGVNYLAPGVKTGELKKNTFVPDHFLFSAFGREFKRTINLTYQDVRVSKYLLGEELNLDMSDGYGALKVENCPLGGFKMSAGRFKNHYPKGLRNFK